MLRNNFSRIIVLLVLFVGFSNFSQSLVTPQQAPQNDVVPANDVIQLSYDKKVEEKIQQVISGYQMRMDPERIRQIPKSILAESKIYDYDPMFLTALIITESSFNTRARSNRGAIGLMQIVPTTGVAMASEKKMAWEGKPTLYNPQANIALGAYYLNKLHNRFGDLDLALEAYNHGPTKLAKYLKRGYQPTRYSKKVFKIYKMIDFEPV